MAISLPHPDEIARAPQAFRDALAELVQLGLTVARMVAQIAAAEQALATEVPLIGVAESLSAPAGSLAEAIMADQAAVATAELRQKTVARAASISEAFAKASRAVRLTVLLAERLDRGWARRGNSDDRRAMKRRQIARGVEDAIGRQAEGEQADRLTEALAERLESLDTESDMSDRPAEEIILEICRDLGIHPGEVLAPAMATGPTDRQAAKPGEAAPHAARPTRSAAAPPHRRPDG